MAARLKGPRPQAAPSPRPPVDRATYAAEMFAHYQALDRALVANGWPKTSDWWLRIVKKYFESACRQAVLRVGRRGGKSSTLCRIAVVEALYGRHDVPPGDTGFVAFISQDRAEAGGRLRTVRDILDVIGIKYHPIEGGIALDNRRVGFRVFTATIKGVSGFTSICVIADEVAKWRDVDTGANPATEVLASVRPTMATMPLAKIILSSSPMGRLDAHAVAFEQGDTDFQFVGFAPTWVANPTITEADTHKLEPNEARRKREYGGIPMEGTEESLLTAVMLDRAQRADDSPIPPEKDRAGNLVLSYVAAMDPGFTRNAWTFVICCKRLVGHVVKRSVVYTYEKRGTPEKPNDPKAILKEIANICKPYGVDTIYTDQYQKFGLGSIAQDPGINLHIIVPSWNSDQRLGAYEDLELWAANGELDIPKNKYVRNDLLGVRRKLTPNGMTISLVETPDGRHSDFAPAIAMALNKATVDPPMPVATGPKYGTYEYWEEEERQMRELAMNPPEEQDDWEEAGY